MAFGTTFQPNETQMTAILEAARQRPDIGWIMSLKEEWKQHKMVKESGLPNVLLKAFVPQLELLHDSRLFAFITHGGSNSIMESLYYGKPLIASPIDADQHGSSYRLQRMGVGKTLGVGYDSDKVLAAVDEI